MQPGDVTKYMAQPWHADFNECSIQPIVDNPNSNSKGGDAVNYWWWPAQRPWSVYPQQPTPGPIVQVNWDRGFLQDPDTATVADPNLGDMQMVECWKDLGFILAIPAPPGSPQLVEVERRTAAIKAYRKPVIKAQRAAGEAEA